MKSYHDLSVSVLEAAEAIRQCLTRPLRSKKDVFLSARLLVGCWGACLRHRGEAQLAVEPFLNHLTLHPVTFGSIYAPTAHEAALKFASLVNTTLERAISMSDLVDVIKNGETSQMPSKETLDFVHTEFGKAKEAFKRVPFPDVREIVSAMLVEARRLEKNEQTKTNNKASASKQNRPPKLPKDSMVQKLIMGKKNPKNKNKSAREIAMGITEDDERKAKSIEAQARRYLKAEKAYHSSNHQANT